MSACGICLSVRPSVTFVDHVKTNKHIFEIFSPSSGSHTILVFPYQRRWRYSDGNPPNGGVECGWGIGRNRDSGLIAGWRLLHVRSAKNIYRRRSWVYDTVGHAHTGYRSIAGRANYEVTKTVTDDPCSVDRTVGVNAPSNVCLWRPAAWTNMPKRREEKRKEFNCMQWSIWNQNN